MWQFEQARPDLPSVRSFHSSSPRATRSAFDPRASVIPAGCLKREESIITPPQGLHGFAAFIAHGLQAFTGAADTMLWPFMAQGLPAFAMQGLRVFAAQGLRVFAKQGLRVFAAQGLRVFAAQGLRVFAAQGLRVFAARGLRVFAAQGLRVLAAQGLRVLAAQGLRV